MPASPTGGQGLTQEALIEVLRNQRQNIVHQQNLIAGQGAQISELTKLVSGLVQMQTDVSPLFTMPTWPCELRNRLLLPLSPLGGWFCCLVLFGCWFVFGSFSLAVGMQPV